jgi:hypothetical protein
MQPGIVVESVGSKPGSNGNGNGHGTSKHENALVNHKRGELIHFAQLSRNATARIEMEKSLREVSLKANKMQETERLQLARRLHGVVVRFLDLTNPREESSVQLPNAVADGVADGIAHGKTGNEIADASLSNQHPQAPKPCAKINPLVSATAFSMPA